MSGKLVRKYTGPRAYVLVKDPKTGKATGMTVRMSAREVVKRMEEVFAGEPLSTST